MTHALRIVVPRYGADVVGGSEGLVRRLAHALAAERWEVSVWTSTAGDEARWTPHFPPGEERDGDVLVRRFAVVRSRSPEVFATVSRGFFRLPARLRPEHLWIAAQGPLVPSMVAALASASPSPTIFTPYLFYPTLAGIRATAGVRVLMPAAHDERPFRLRAVAAAVDAADVLWYHSPEERALMERIHPRAGQRPAAVGTVAVAAPPSVAGERARAKLGVGDDPYLLHGGRRAAGKGLDELLEGFRHLRRDHPRARLVLTGEAGAGLGSGDGVVAVGQLSDADRWDAVAGAAAIVAPGFFESLSMLTLEAWACGRPVIANGASAVLCGQIRRSQGGVTYRGPAELARAAARFLDDPDTAAAHGASGRAYVNREYQWKAVSQRLESLIAAAATTTAR